MIEAALKRNGLHALHIMADIPETVEMARQNVAFEFDSNIKTLAGYIQDTYKQQKWDEVDFLFIDADHGQQFAEWYFDNLFPLICEGVPIHVHDIDLWNNWKWYKSPNPSEAVEFLKRHKEDKLGLKKLLWMFDYTYNPAYADKLAKIRKKYPFVGEQTLDLPFKNGASYWKKL